MMVIKERLFWLDNIYRYHNINSIEPTVVNISAMSGIDLLTFLMNDKFVKCVADFISNAWYKRQHALFN